jgi:hypothetical protein
MKASIIIIFHHEFRPGWPFRSQLSYRLVVSYVVFQVVVFLLDDNSEIVLGACCLPPIKKTHSDGIILVK